MKLKNIIKKIIKGRKVPIANMIYSNKMLENKVALITGGNSGIGFSIAQEFIKNGCKVIICGRDEKKLNKCKKNLGENARILVIDVKNIESFNEKIVEASMLFDEKRIDILVNSAGVGAENDFLNIKPEKYDEIMDINLKGTFFMTQQMGIYMKNNNIKGHILNISSSSALRPAWTPYEISKWGVRGFTLGAADVLSKYGIIVNAIAPGPTVTPMLNADQDDISINTTCSERMLLPCEISTLAVYMCSDFGNMIIGDTFYVTGGAGNIINRF